MEDIIVRYQKGENFSATIIGRGVDSSTIVYILRAVQDKDFQHLKRLKENINFSCIVIDNGNETVI